MYGMMEYDINSEKREREIVLKPKTEWNGEHILIITWYFDSDYSKDIETRRSVIEYTSPMNRVGCCAEEMLYANKVMESIVLKYWASYDIKSGI